MSYVTHPDELAAIVPSLANAETAKIAILRPTTHFEIVTPDNPDMIRTLEQQEEYVQKKLVLVEGDLAPEELAQVRTKFEREFQTELSRKAAFEQGLLKSSLSEHGIAVSEIIEDKGQLETSAWNYYTDQVFATDTGQYFDKDGQLTFIPSSFKNQQRKGEERLAHAQAENYAAHVHPLVSDAGKPLTFEGGDIRQMPGKKLFFIGQGHRSDGETSRKIADISGYSVVPIVLLQQQFYHLDCCFLPLPNNAAVIYEGDFILNDKGEKILDSQGWPKIQPGTETMTPESRALIRTVYPADKLVLIGKAEALAFATNAAVLQNVSTGRFKMFVNGDRFLAQENESEAIDNQIISYSKEQIEQLQQVTNHQMDVVEIPYKTMHGSGGSIRCSIQEVACTDEAMKPHKKNTGHFSKRAEEVEHRHSSKTVNLSFFARPLERKDSDEIIRKVLAPS